MKYFNILFIFLVVISCKAKKSHSIDCTDLKSGKYEYRSRLTKGRVAIERNDSIQTELESETGIGMKFSITWTSSCEYVLSFQSFIDTTIEVEKSTNIPEIKVEIIKVTPNYYISQSFVDGNRDEHVDTLLILK